MNKAWPYYVYALTEGETIRYIGKGSKRRLVSQMRRFGLDGHEMARFKSERSAYAFEVSAIAEHAPPLNVHKGGNGSRASLGRRPKGMSVDQTRVYAARGLLKFGDALLRYLTPESIAAIRAVAHGC